MLVLQTSILALGHTSMPGTSGSWHAEFLIILGPLLTPPLLARIWLRIGEWPRRVNLNAVVICENCATVRVGETPETGRFLANREQFRRLRGLLLVTLAFLLVGIVARWIVQGRPRTELLVYGVVGGAFLGVDILGHIYFHRPARWTEHLFPR
jgi:hypothetical protein